MDTDIERLASKYHSRLPGIVRAALNDSGISDEVIDRHGIGWDDEFITVPVRSRTGSVAFFEKWIEIGLPAEELGYVELFPWETVKQRPELLVICEGVHECLVVESAGFPAVCATGSGLYFKAREWVEELDRVPQLVVALKRGDKRERKKGRLSRREVEAKIRMALPEAKVIPWPAEVGDGGGAADLYLRGGSVADWLGRFIESHG